jgi:putative membrane protein
MMYLWIKAFHIIAVISWMAGMLYLPRLLVYHVGAEAGSQQARTFAVMEHRILTYIMTPAMGETWVLGIVLVLQGGWLASGWLHAKLVAVVAMTVMHGLLRYWTTELARGRNKHSQKFYRVINEVPTVLLIFIVIMAVVKPF